MVVDVDVVDVIVDGNPDSLKDGIDGRMFCVVDDEVDLRYFDFEFFCDDEDSLLVDAIVVFQVVGVVVVVMLK